MTRASAARPDPVPVHLYSAAALDAFAAGEHAAFLAAGGRPLRPRLARALALADLRPGLAVVDIGAGRGEAALHAARRGARVTALDFSPDALALTRRTLAVASGPSASTRRTDLVRAAATSLPLPDGCADRVLLLDVVEHLHPWQLAACLAEVRRILHRRGHVVIHTLPNRWALALTYPLLRLGRPGWPADARSAYEHAVHVNEQDPRALARSLRAAGLQSRVWVEEWTTRHAARAAARAFPDAARAAGYPVLGRRRARWWARLAMATPLRWVVGNDIFALAWLPGTPGPPARGRFRAVR